VLQCALQCVELCVAVCVAVCVAARIAMRGKQLALSASKPDVVFKHIL